ncbi:predicted protein [Aspergillus terreus NIH2624]|uniref:F-box domain-containing protein n=1 Tax=Aspergillus terreus (strain NIH 2624 / FGSC A1156) TaxID=341663 RepID=Q0CRD1_ASPTN|nr:uncharacterized protein ATEG_03753 [Aspergillus terreus NIH2624]EAU35555.1 predicted protein [Aspergillus terreus NIH2624]
MGPKRQGESSLIRCPADILHMVLKMLSVTEHRTLCLVNQDIRAIAEPFLYSKIQWTWQKDRPDSPPPITQLLRTLLSRPQLAGYITNVRLDGYTYRIDRTGFRWTIPQIPIPNDELDKPIAFIQRMGLPYTICEDYGLPNFGRLQDVSFLVPQGRDEAWDRKIKNTADVLPFFYLPNVQRMSASIQNPDEFRWSISRLPDPAKLVSLHLTHVREGYLRELLAVTKKLRTLRWEWYFDYGVEDQFTTPIIDLPRLLLRFQLFEIL